MEPIVVFLRGNSRRHWSEHYDQIWLGTEPVDMRAGMDTLLSRVVMVFGAAQPHHAYLFTNRR
ncbi:IS66 family insertion sequence element accessory protein TnpB, partial [Advenella sp. WQ 585]